MVPARRKEILIQKFEKTVIIWLVVHEIIMIEMSIIDRIEAQ